MAKLIDIDRRPIDRILAPFQAFIRRDASPGILLILCTVIALAWANSPWAESYQHFWHIPIGIHFGKYQLTFSLQHWINDGLMAMFFFVVGLEIKREILAGELSCLRQATLPIIAAIGGMVVPALIYFLFNTQGETSAGWGIPMATDIAFAIGVLTLFGNRIPLSLKIFLTALAIVDDIGAVLVIAFFYTSDLNLFELFIGMLFLSTLAAGNYMGVRKPLFYAVVGIGGLWLAFLLSGIHPSIAGVLAAFTIPAKSRIKTKNVAGKLKPILQKMEERFNQRSNTDNQENNDEEEDEDDILSRAQLRVISNMEKVCEYASTPLQRLEKALHHWVIFAVMPLFALANAGVAIETSLEETLSDPVALGIILGLVLGKQIGIMLFSYITIKLQFASLPRGVTYGSLYGVSCLAGIGFTMSLFIAGLAFESNSSAALATSKLGILIASLIAGIFGWLIIALTCPVRKKETATSDSKD